MTKAKAPTSVEIQQQLPPERLEQMIAAIKKHQPGAYRPPPKPSAIDEALAKADQIYAALSPERQAKVCHPNDVRRWWTNAYAAPMYRVTMVPFKGRERVVGYFRGGRIHGLTYHRKRRTMANVAHAVVWYYLYARGTMSDDIARRAGKGLKARKVDDTVRWLEHELDQHYQSSKPNPLTV